MPQAKITVVIPVFNREAYIKQAVESVRNQSYLHWKMLIVNDGSTDKTALIISKFSSDKRIKVITLPHNQGTAKALQTALNQIDTPYFMIVDSDDWIEASTLSVLLNEMKKQPKNISLIYGNTMMWQEKKGTLKKIHVEKHRPFQDKYDFLLYTKMFYPRFFRTEAVRRVGGFKTDDPYQGRYAEDRYLLLRLIPVSQFQWVNKELYNLRKHSNNITKRENRKKFLEVVRYITSKALKDWGNKYEPVYKVNKGGWLYIKELKKVKEEKN